MRLPKKEEEPTRLRREVTPEARVLAVTGARARTVGGRSLKIGAVETHPYPRLSWVNRVSAFGIGRSSALRIASWSGLRAGGTGSIVAAIGVAIEVAEAEVAEEEAAAQDCAASWRAAEVVLVSRWT